MVIEEAPTDPSRRVYGQPGSVRVGSAHDDFGRQRPEANGFNHVLADTKVYRSRSQIEGIGVCRSGVITLLHPPEARMEGLVISEHRNRRLLEHYGLPAMSSDRERASPRK